MGTLIVNNQFQFAMDRIAEAIEGPAAAETDTTMTFIPNPRPNNGFVE